METSPIGQYCMGVRKKNIIERALGIFTEVNSGEGTTALLMTLNIFLILTSYLIAKVVREPLILGGGGAELKSYASAIQVVLLLGVVRLYAWLVAGFPRRKLINYVTLFFSGCLLFFYFLYSGVEPPSGIFFFLWVGIFSLVIIAQFWSYANDIYSPNEGKRLFVILAFGASAGGVIGPMLAGALLDLVGLYNLLLVSAGILLASLLLTNYIDSRLQRRPRESAEDNDPLPEEPAMSKQGALKVVFRSKYLLMIAFLILLSNWVNSTGEYILGSGVESAAGEIEGGADAAKAFIGRFYADFYTLVGFVGMLMQLFIVSRVIKYLGIRTALMTLPIIAIGSYMLIAIYPVLGIIRWSKTAENATDYSLNNTVRHILFLPTTKEEKYKAKVAIDSFFVRAGDVLSAALVFVGVTWLSFEIYQFALFCLVLTTVWLWLAFRIGVENRRLEKARTTVDRK